jgi:hypothetical protein
MLIIERIIALIFLATMIWGAWISELTMVEFMALFMLCHIWIATIDMRKKNIHDNQT